MNQHGRRPSGVRACGVAATAILVGIAGFQAALALGAPLGKAAWGGGSAELSTALRLGSAMAVLVWSFAAAVVFQRSGLGESRLSTAFVRKATWAIFGLTLLASVANWASRSPAERYSWGPATLLLAALLFVVARGDRSDRDQAPDSPRNQ